MICKEDVVEWFKEIESYKRIDTMCTLLNMCLPFELRFLGTCLEELGRRDSQELRGIELRVNNPAELASDVASCRIGEPTDLKIRRKMALYLALIRACNRPCANELFLTLNGWGDRDFYKFGDGDPLQELLLVYTMASNHPVFSFEQRMKCGEIYQKINECNKELESPRQQQQPSSPSPIQFSNSSMVQPQRQKSTTPTTCPSAQPAPPPPHQQKQQQQQQIQQMSVHQIPAGMIMNQGTVPLGFPSQNTMTQMIPAESTTMISVDEIAQIMPHTLTLNQDFGNAAMPWTLRHGIMHASYPPPSLEAMNSTASLPLSSDSPISKPSSPVPSRSSSPLRNSNQIAPLPPAQQQQQQSRTSNLQQQQRTSNVMHRLNRRSSDVVTPPPPPPQQQQQLQNQIIVNSMDLTTSATSSSASLQNSKNFDEIGLNVDGALTQLTTICRNGYTRPLNHTIPRQSNKTTYLHHLHHQQHQQQMQQQQQQQVTPPISYNNQFQLQKNNFFEVNNMMDQNHQHQIGSGGGGVNDGIVINSRQKSAESDSGGSSIESLGESSPPNTPSGNLTKELQTKNRHIGSVDKLSNSPQQQPHYIFVPTTGGLQQYQQQQQQQYSISENGQLILTPNNNAGGVNNNNILTTQQQQHISASTNPIVLQQPYNLSPQQQTQFSTSYPYPIQHLVPPPPPPQQPPNSRLITQVQLLPHQQQQQQQHYQQQFSRQSFQIQPNGDILYPYAPPQPNTITFLQQSPLSGGLMQRSSPSIQQQQSILVDTTSRLQNASSSTVDIAPTFPPAITAASATLNSNKLSCFNCGSQVHSGRECQEASMEDVTRGSIYKLDYSAILASLSAADAAALAAANSSSGSSSSSNTSVVGATTSGSSPFNSSSSLGNTSSGNLGSSNNLVIDANSDLQISTISNTLPTSTGPSTSSIVVANSSLVGATVTPPIANKLNINNNNLSK